MIWPFLLFLLAGGLERLTARPFLATLAGRAFARLLRGRRISPKVYEVSALPAFGFKAAAQTWGETVLVVHGYRTSSLLAHEAVHVRQFRRYTSLGFWLLYLGQWLVGLARTRDLYGAYRGIALEREARALSSLAAQGRNTGTPDL